MPDMGLIPAHAGKTVSSRLDTCPSQAHPRSRGENGREESKISKLIGSSPLTRGKPAFQRASAPRARLIPAHAGKTGHMRPPPLQ